MLTRVTPGPPFPAPGHRPAMPTSHQVCLCLFPGVPSWNWHLPLTLPATPPASHPKDSQEGCLWSHLPWNGLCSWRLVAGPGGRVFFRRLLDYLITLFAQLPNH